jgi:hypothetical protein
MAESLLRHEAGDRFEVASAGVAPTQVKTVGHRAMNEINRIRGKLFYLGRFGCTIVHSSCWSPGNIGGLPVGEIPIPTPIRCCSYQ